MKYIAYGSNMSREQMAYRCPGARLLGTGTLHGYRLEFNLHATIVETGNPKDTVPVAVWELTPEHEASLDCYEGFPKYYRKITCTVCMTGGGRLKGMAYQMCREGYRPPTRMYYEGIRDAYKNLGLAPDVERTLITAVKRSFPPCGG